MTTLRTFLCIDKITLIFIQVWSLVSGEIPARKKEDRDRVFNQFKAELKFHKILTMGDLTDKDILNAIFSPLLPHGEVLEEDFSTLEEKEEETELTKQAKDLEIEGVKLAETGNLEVALQKFSRAIEVAPGRASGYNNRAQALRLTGKIDEALADLDSAIQLSEGKGRAACQAYCQRGLIHLKNNSPEQAKTDFEKATKLGSQFARAQLVQMNPYAALCNSMLKDVFGKLQQSETRESFHEEAPHK